MVGVLSISITSMFFFFSFEDDNYSFCCLAGVRERAMVGLGLPSTLLARDRHF
jgi:hypothetical protein